MTGKEIIQVLFFTIVCALASYAQNTHEVQLLIGDHRIHLPIDEYVRIDRYDTSYNYDAWMNKHERQYEGSFTGRMDVKKSEVKTWHQSVDTNRTNGKLSISVERDEVVSEPVMKISELRDTSLFYKTPRTMIDSVTWIDPETLDENTRVYKIDSLRFYFDLSGVSKQDIANAVRNSFGITPLSLFQVKELTTFAIIDSFYDLPTVRYDQANTIEAFQKSIFALPAGTTIIISSASPMSQQNEPFFPRYNYAFAIIHLSD